MNREIKFRAWNGIKLITGESLYWNGVSFVSGIWNFEEDCIPVENQESVEIVQYTGLKDKNGVEIYEGDIVRYEHYIGFVAFEFAEFILKSESQGNYDVSPRAPTSDEDYEVIGNIYQNPELLEPLRK